MVILRRSDPTQEGCAKIQTIIFLCALWTSINTVLKKSDVIFWRLGSVWGVREIKARVNYARLFNLHTTSKLLLQKYFHLPAKFPAKKAVNDEIYTGINHQKKIPNWKPIMVEVAAGHWESVGYAQQSTDGVSQLAHHKDENDNKQRHCDVCFLLRGFSGFVCAILGRRVVSYPIGQFRSSDSEM